MKDKFFEKFTVISNWIYRVVHYWVYSIIVRKRCKNSPRLSSKERKAIRTYWKRHFGKAVPLVEYKWFKEIADCPDPRFISDVIWHSEIEPYFANMQMLDGFSDKNYFETIVGKKNSPETVCRCIDGDLQVDDFKAATVTELLESIRKYNELICKPTIGSCGGKGIQFFNGTDVSEELVKELVNKYDGNFIIQKVIEQHSSVKRFNPESINTIRIITFLFHRKMHVLGAFLRIGGKGSRTDNVSQGGMMIPIHKDGKYFDYALKCIVKNQSLEKRDVLESGEEFKGFRIEGWDSIIETIDRLHHKLAHFHLIYWDVALQKDETPIIVEYNLIDTDAYDIQYEQGPIFGNMTEEVLDEIKQAKKSRN